MILRRLPSAFTLTELLATMGVLAVFAMLLTSVLGGSMNAVRNTERTLRDGAAIREFGSVMGEDLSAFQPSNLPGRRSQLSVSQSETGVRIAIVRPATRVRNLELAGYTSHVVYSWNRERREVTRTEYNSASDRAAAGRTTGSPDGQNHEANNTRATVLAPAWTAKNDADWLEDDRLAQLAERAQSVPLLTHVRSFEIASFKDHALTEESTDSDNPDSVPAVLRFRMEFAGDGTSAVHPVEVLLPVGAGLAR